MNTTKKKDILEKNEVKKPSWRFRAAIISFAVIAVAGVFIVLFAFVFKGGVDQSAYSIGYVIETQVVTGSLNVEMNIDIHSLSRNREILFLKGLMSADFIGCTDETGNDVAFTETEDLIAIGPVEAETKRLCFKYVAHICEIADDFNVMAATYAHGCILEDLVVFSGEYAILIPFLNPDSFDSINKYINKISFEFTVPDGLDPIIPFHTLPPVGKPFAFSVENLDWDFFNTISKSAFCFGRFEKIGADDIFEGTAVYVDKAVIDRIPQLTVDAMTGLLNYYSNLFTEPLNDVPIVLLRNLDAEDTVILGGAGSRCAAISAKLRLANDVQALSNMLYHAFFDSKVKPRNLRYPGNHWIYRGLSEYYVGNSAGSLPENVAEEYSIGSVTSMNERYLRYLYFSLKEPGFLGVSPIHETTGMYVSQEEFYMGVKIPLIIDAINYSAERTGQHDGFIRALVRKGGGSKPLNVERFLKDICGRDYDMIENFISGKALITNYRGFSADGMPIERLLYLLNEDEQKYAYFFEQDKVFYPYSALFLLYEEAFMQEVSKRGIRYNTDEIQNEVYKFSPVVHRLLLQYAMWASLAGVDDITQPNIKRAITKFEVTEQWKELCNKVGLEYALEDYSDYAEL